MSDVRVPPQRARDLVTRALFTGASRAGGTAHAALCSLYFSIRHRTPDPWGYARSQYESGKRDRVLAATDALPWTRALDVGCSEGAFTRALAERAPACAVTGADIAPAAIARATRRCADLPHVRFVRADVFHALPPGPFDLVICAELLYYAGVRVATLARLVAAALRPGGHVVLAHPWPEARALHRPFVDSSFTPVAETVYEHPVRPYAVTVLARS